ncbi:MAG: hypothetical protein LBJ73_02680 [Rickettsiales bacterium]|jgi:hypothetical protein|nr:hypothetical protein [Rickettsiales bacterium]
MHKISYIGDGATTEFLFAFPFFQEADVRVAVDGKLLDASQYDAHADENFDGGYVVFAAAPAAGAAIDIFRQISLSRVVDYQPTAKIDPENLNTDFNFLLEAFRDLRAVDIDLAEWKNVHDNVLSFIKYTTDIIEDKLSGGSVLGLYNNLLSVLDNALPRLINDYGSVGAAAQNENSDDYGML